MARYPVWKQRVEHLYEELFSTLYRMGLRSLSDRNQARDTLQEAFVKLLGSNRKSDAVLQARHLLPAAPLIHPETPLNLLC